MDEITGTELLRRMALQLFETNQPLEFGEVHLAQLERAYTRLETERNAARAGEVAAMIDAAHLRKALECYTAAERLVSWGRQELEDIGGPAREALAFLPGVLYGQALLDLVAAVRQAERDLALVNGVEAPAAIVMSARWILNDALRKLDKSGGAQ